MELQTMKSLKV